MISSIMNQNRGTPPKEVIQISNEFDELIKKRDIKCPKTISFSVTNGKKILRHPKRFLCEILNLMKEEERNSLFKCSIINGSITHDSRKNIIFLDAEKGFENDAKLALKDKSLEYKKAEIRKINENNFLTNKEKEEKKKRNK
jgi:hypothetical protein